YTPSGYRASSLVASDGRRLACIDHRTDYSVELDSDAVSPVGRMCRNCVAAMSAARAAMTAETRPVMFSPLVDACCAAVARDAPTASGSCDAVASAPSIPVFATTAASGGTPSGRVSVILLR